MVSEKMKPFMANNSAIRAMFEEGKKMAAVYGAETYTISVWEIPMCRFRRSMRPSWRS